MNITVVGSGYVGLVTGACIAEMGNTVYCVDVDKSKIENLKQGILPIYEPGLEEIVTENHSSGRLLFTTSLSEAAEQCEVYFIAVGTPPGEDGSADLRYVLEVARQIGDTMTGPAIVVNKSTVPVGTADLVRAAVTERLEARGSDIAFSVVSNPEFLKEGAAVDDFMHPDRIVIGADNEHARQVMSALYAPFIRNRPRTMFMGIRDAEMTKYAANAMLATKISFMNEIASLCERLGCGCRERTSGHRLGRADRLPLHLRWLRLRWLVLPERRQGADQHCAPERLRAQAAASRGIPQRSAEALAVQQDLRPFQWRSERPHFCCLGPGVQARHRRHARGAQRRADQ